MYVQELKSYFMLKVMFSHYTTMLASDIQMSGYKYLFSQLIDVTIFTSRKCWRNKMITSIIFTKIHYFINIFIYLLLLAFISLSFSLSLKCSESLESKLHIVWHDTLSSITLTYFIKSKNILIHTLSPTITPKTFKMEVYHVWRS